MSDPYPGTAAESVREYRSRGWWAVPVPAGRKGPVMRAWTSARIDGEEIAASFPPGSNVGLLLGEPSGWLVDVDLDCDEAVELAAQFLPRTGAITGRTSRPGSHRWYVAVGAANARHEDPFISRGGDDKTVIVELRSTGHQTLVGPSVHPEDGERYDMLRGDPAVVDGEHLAKCVEALARAVVARRHPGETATEKASNASPSERAAARPAADHSAQTLRRAEAYVDKIPPAVSGQGGHNQTYAAATAMVHGFGLDPETAFTLLRDRYNPRCQPPWTERELRHKVTDAATKPHDRPFGWLRDADAEIATPAGPDTHAAEPPKFALTDLGNAERLAASCENVLRFCVSTGRWLEWEGRRWRDDDQGAVLRRAGEVVRGMLVRAAGASDSVERAELAKWSLKSESRQRLDAMVSLAQARPSFVVRAADLDRDAWSFNCLNGTVDLRTGQLRAAEPADLITKLADVRYDPGATCPRFVVFLNQIFAGDAEVIAFVQRLLGMCLTADIREQVLVIFHGDGSNGKSVLIDVVRTIMGGYAGIAPPSLVAEMGRSEHPTEIADLLGRRLVVASESEENTELKVQQIKRLTGDATLKGRFMRQDYFEFRRTHKLFLVTNNKPRIRENSHAVWRRLRIVPFNVIIPDARQDTTLMTKLLEESPGILNWLVAGCLAWQREGLGSAPRVDQVTAGYRREEDHVARFLYERCEVEQAVEGQSADLFTPWAELKAAYTEWCAGMGAPPRSDKDLQSALDRLGLRTVTRRWQGKPAKGREAVRLLSQEEVSLHEQAVTALPTVTEVVVEHHNSISISAK